MCDCEIWEDCPHTGRKASLMTVADFLVKALEELADEADSLDECVWIENGVGKRDPNEKIEKARSIVDRFKRKRPA